MAGRAAVVLVVLCALALVAGLVADSLLFIYLSLTCCVLAAVALVIHWRKPIHVRQVGVSGRVEP